MRALTRDVYGGPEVLRWAEVEPGTPGPGEVRLAVRAASLNPADLHLLKGEPFVARFAFGLPRPKRKGLGADVAGVVVAVGEGVTRLGPGDAVFGDLSGHGFGALADEVVTAEAALARLLAGASFAEAAATPMAAVTALQALRDKGRLQRGEHVLVTGASGGVGAFAVQLAKALGARVTAVTSTPHIEQVSGLGADDVIDRNAEDFRAARARYDVVVESAGQGSVREALKVLKPGGRFVFVGGSGRATLAALVMGKSMLAQPNLQDLEEVARLVEAGAVRPQVGVTFPMQDALEAVRRFASGSTHGKVVLTLGEQKGISAD